ncbi:helicase-related protein [Marinimicrobium sp. C2-29]|uniref:helicase-related protein n=1 Tax=Marinimicrobium sp. C2-29 TaxID=3139825 RepID=UPI0031399EF0
MNPPDTEKILAPLKGFQLRTVDHAFHQLFEAADSPGRFLVADEVGLGKTLVARGVIAKAVERLWLDVDRIDIIYICSNQSIARSNLPKLRISGDNETSLSLASRLTMLATELAPTEGQKGLADSKLNFVSFTPGTSFNMGNSAGKSEERQVLFHLLDGVVEPRVGLMNFFQGQVKNRKSWRSALRDNPLPLEKGIAKRFRQRLKVSKRLQAELHQTVALHFSRYREIYPKEVSRTRRRLIGELRQLLAEVCVAALEPDLVVVDEFQRFKTLLDPKQAESDPAAEIAQALFNAESSGGDVAKVLLLSATPYKLFTTDAEIEQEDHYQDFIATTAFLLGHDDQRVARLKSAVNDYGRALRRAASGEVERIVPAKAELEQCLREVMARTERVGETEEHDGMVSEPAGAVAVEAEDVRQYLAADAVFRAVGDRDPMAYWKAAPYLTNFMHRYKVNERIQETLQTFPGKLAKVFSEHESSLLSYNAVSKLQPIPAAHAKLRDLSRRLIDVGLWKLLWMPPTVPYWPLAGAFEGQQGQSKALLFSAWNMVPDVVSGLLSYEAERRMLGPEFGRYEEPDRQQSPLLRLTESGGSRSRHRLLLLLLPCLTLADKAHPLAAPEGADRKEWVRNRVAELLDELPNPQEGAVDSRWEWAAPLLLDPGMQGFLEAWPWDDTRPEYRPNPEYLPGYIDDLLSLDVSTLGRRPDDLVDMVTDLALGSPSVLAARMLDVDGISTDVRRELSARAAYSFWRLFNRPAVIRLLRQLYVAGSADEDAYWHKVLLYCRDGNLQAVLDETWHLLSEQHGWAPGEGVDDVCRQCVSDVVEMVEPRPSRALARCYSVKGGRVESEELHLRMIFALRLGHLQSDENVLNQDVVRKAFNSPFRPFLLCSTSVGQEGLDFHPWCHRIIHWNLPGNPVDMEQREGRVHRYKGHAVRKNVAARFSSEALESWRQQENLWEKIFELANRAAREAERSELVPYWVAPGDAKIERHVPALPYTSEVEAFAKLKRQLAAYRVVFGQPRQEELLDLLDQSQITREQLEEWSIDLAPLALRQS